MTDSGTDAPYSAVRDDLIGQRVEWQGESWFVALAQHDTEDEGRGHWHLTLTAPQPAVRPQRCKVGHSDRIQGCRYCAALFVAGVADRLGVEPPETTKRLLR